MKRWMVVLPVLLLLLAGSALAEGKRLPLAVGAPFEVVKPASVPIAALVPTPTSVPTPTPAPALQNGSRGEAVSRLQARLSELGYLTGRADGIFGNQTKSVVLAFQQANGLAATGIADADTQALLFSERAQGKPAPTPTPRAKGASGADVKAAQQALRTYGFMTASADGEFGAKTDAAVRYLEFCLAEREWMRTRANTISSIFAALSGQAESMPEFETTGVLTDALLTLLTGGSFETYIKTQKGGDSGTETARIQRRLKVLLYRYENADGVYDEMTAKEISRFQRLNALPETGVADEFTQRLLFSKDAAQSDVRVMPYRLVVNIKDQRVYAFEWNGDAFVQIRAMKCSTGLEGTPTPTGVFRDTGPANRWHYFSKFDCWAQYSYYIYGDIMFHSVLYDAKDESALRKSSVRALGKKASHGCVRLSVEDAQWIFENCPRGTEVEIVSK